MDKTRKAAIAFDALKILLALFLLCFITRLWPLLFLIILGIFVAALRLLFLTAKKAPDEKPASTVTSTTPPRQDTEQDVVRIAFGILQRRINLEVSSRYPAAKWIWETSNAIERFSDGFPLTIMLNHAGGYKKATVQVNNLQFRGFLYETAEPDNPEEPPADPDGEDNSSPEDDADDIDQTDYSIVAFEWVDANFERLNSACNAAIAAREPTMLVPAGALPVRASWESICFELEHIGLGEPTITDSGIQVTVPK